MWNSLPLKQQYLRVKQHKKSKHKKYWAVLHQSTDSNASRLELFANEKASRSEMPETMLVIKDFVKAVCKEDKPEFVLATRKDAYTFTADEMTDAHDWIRIIQDLMRDNGTDVETSNPVYECTSSFQQQREFTVTSTPETENRTSIRGKCRLIIENGYIRLLSQLGDRYFRWYISNIRRYGFTTSMFHFEAGSKSDTGQGDFSLLTTMGKEIHALVSSEIDIARERVRQNRGSGEIVKTMPQALLSNQVLGSLPSSSTPQPVTNKQNEASLLVGHIYEPLTPVPSVKPAVSKKPPRNSHDVLVPKPSMPTPNPAPPLPLHTSVPGTLVSKNLVTREAVKEIKLASRIESVGSSPTPAPLPLYVNIPGLPVPKDLV